MVARRPSCGQGAVLLFVVTGSFRTALGGYNRGVPTPERVVMLDELLEQMVVIDLVSPYVCLGKLVRYDENFLELRNADLHDTRDTETTRENYVAESVATGIKRNRKRVFLRRGEMIAISKLDDVVDE